MSRNPYHHDGQAPTLVPSVFSFMDILGYTDLIKTSERDGTSEQTLQRIHSALSRGRNWLEDKDGSEEFRNIFSKDLFSLKAFTDNIVISWPVHNDAESEMGSAFFKLGAFQFQMVLEGFFIRGAISVGEAYVDEIAVFGEALIEAYEGEAKFARDPRIILTNSAVEVVKLHLNYYPNQYNAPHVNYILRDSDGQWFLNYLEGILWAENEQGPFYDELAKHKDAVEAKLAQYKGNPAIWSKYAWVASYHNYFCDFHSHHFSDEHKVDVELFKQSPSLIIDEN